MSTIPYFPRGPVPQENRRTAGVFLREQNLRQSCYVFVDSLPKNSYGKVLKRELRLRLESER